jgi:hypothetical protein
MVGSEEHITAVHIWHMQNWEGDAQSWHTGTQPVLCILSLRESVFFRAAITKLGKAFVV